MRLESSAPAGGASEAEGSAEPRSPPGTWRLLAPALVCWAVTAWTITAPGSAAVIGVAAGISGVALLLGVLLTRTAALRRALRATLSLTAIALAALVLIGAKVAIAEATREDPAFESASARGSSIGFEARLSGYPESKPTPFGSRSWVRAEAQTASGPIPVLLWLDGAAAAPSRWAPGTEIVVRGRLEAQAPADPVAYTVTVLELRESQRQPLSALFGAVAAELRSELVRNSEGVPGAQLVPGFAVGDTSLVPATLDDAMLASSLRHLTAVSGSNTGLVVAAVIWSCSRLGAGRRLRTAIAALALIGFVVIVGPDASVQRAAVMAAVLLSSGFGGRRSGALPALGLAVLVLLALDPWQALQPGFALSVTATAGILLCATPLTDWLRRRTRMPRPLALSLAVALSAQFACGPLLLLLQPGIPAVGVLANVIAAPAAPLGTGLGLVAAVLGPFSAELARLTVLLASAPARWVAATAHVTAAMPLGRWSWPEGWAGALLLAACQGALLAAWALRRGTIPLLGVPRPQPRAPWRPAPPLPRAIALVSALLASASFASVIAVTLVTPLADRLSTPSGWAVVACDVGQGDALLLRNPARPDQVMLVDTGDDAQLLRDCLDRFGVARVDTLVLSHDDRDHVGALDAVVERVERAIIAPTSLGERTERREVVRSLEAATVPYEIGEAGARRSSSHSGVDWQILAPTAGRAPPDSNAASLVMLVDAGPVRVLLLGDTGYDEQHSLLRAGAALSAEVLKVAHHGSGDQDQALPSAVAARWALVSVGAENRYGHPAADTLAAIARAGTRALRTDLHGSIALVPTADGQLVPWLQRSRAG